MRKYMSTLYLIFLVGNFFCFSETIRASLPLLIAFISPQSALLPSGLSAMGVFLSRPDPTRPEKKPTPQTRSVGYLLVFLYQPLA